MFDSKFIGVLLVVGVGALQALLVSRIRKSLPSIYRDLLRWAGRDENNFTSGPDLLRQFDSMFYESPEYQGLRRLGVSAPLLGILTTALTILTWSKPHDVSAKFDFGSLGILFSGVVSGVFIAIVNQVCLWYVDRECLQTRRRLERRLPKSSAMKVINDFRDRMIQIAEDSRTAFNESIRQTSSVANAKIQQASEDAATNVVQLTGVIGTAQIIVNDFRDQMIQFAEDSRTAFNESIRQTSSVANAKIQQASEEAATNVVQLTGVIGTAQIIVNDFRDQMIQFAEDSRTVLKESITQTSSVASAKIQQASEDAAIKVAQLTGVISTAQNVADTYAAASKKADEAAIIFSQRLETATETLGGKFDDLSKALSESSTKCAAMSKQLTASTTGISEVRVDIAGWADQLTGLVSQTHEALAKRLEEIVSTTKASVAQVAHTFSSSAALVDKVNNATTELFAQISAIPEKLTMAADNSSQSLTESSEQVLASANQLKSAAGTLDQTSTELSAWLKQTSESVQMLVTSKLQPDAAAIIKSFQSQAEDCANASKSLEVAARTVLNSAEAASKTLKSVEHSDRSLENTVALLHKSVREASSQMESQLQILRTWPQTTERMVEHARSFLDQELKRMTRTLAAIIDEQHEALAVPTLRNGGTAAPVDGRPKVAK